MLKIGVVAAVVLAQATQVSSGSAQDASPISSLGFQALIMGIAIVVLRAFGDDIVKISHSIADAIPKRIESAQKEQDDKLDLNDTLIEQVKSRELVIAARDAVIARRDAVIDSYNERIEKFTDVLLESQTIIRDLRAQIDQERQEAAKAKELMDEQVRLKDIAMKALADKNADLERLLQERDAEIAQLKAELDVYRKGDPSPKLVVPPSPSISPESPSDSAGQSAPAQ